MRASFASDPALTRGRLIPEEESTFRSCFQRDRDRIIHASAFRRLKHKTQVFVEHEGDFYRTRLTHTIEVAQVARTICGALGLNTDLTEAVALAHDLGHTPFGHTGEDALHALMDPYGGFDHNAQTIRIVTSLERHYAAFDGLNLTWETLEGIAKHNGPVTGDLPHALAEYAAVHDLELHTHASAEAQVAALADDIAYNNHDLHDGLRAGLFVLARFMDHFDGELARQKQMASRLGYYLDYISGALSYGALFLCLGIGFMHSGLGNWALALGLAGTASAVISMFTNLGIDQQLDLENDADHDAVGYPGFAGFELEDGIYLIAPITWFGYLQSFFVLAGIGAAVYCLWTCWTLLRLRRS